MLGNKRLHRALQSLHRPVAALGIQGLHDGLPIVMRPQLADGRQPGVGRCREPGDVTGGAGLVDLGNRGGVAIADAGIAGPRAARDGRLDAGARARGDKLAF